MISLLRKSPILGSILLFLLLIASKWYLWGDFAEEINQGQFEVLYVLGALIVQAILLRYLIKRNRLLQRDYFLVVFFYLYFAVQGASEDLLVLGLLPCLLMLAIHLIIDLYNVDSPTNRLLGVGTLIGLMAILDPASLVLLPFALLGLSYFVLLDFRKTLIVIYYSVLTLFLGYGLLYALAAYDLSNFSFSWNSNQVQTLIDHPITQALVLVNFAIAVIMILLRAQFLNQRSVKVRNVHRILAISLPFALTFYLFSRELSWNEFALMAIPLASVCAYYFENARRAWIYESVLVILIFVQAFGPWYYQS